MSVSSYSSPFGIPIPNVLAQSQATPPGTPVPGGVISSAIIPIDTDTPPKLGIVRQLKNIAATVFLQSNYLSVATNVTLLGVEPAHQLPTFILYRNGIPVFTSSAQIELQTSFLFNNGTANHTNNQMNGQYGIYADFVNPITLHSGDNLGCQLTTGAFEPIIIDAGTNEETSFLIAAQAIAGQSGVIYYTDSPL